MQTKLLTQWNTVFFITCKPQQVHSYQVNTHLLLTIVPVWCNLSSAWHGNFLRSWVMVEDFQIFHQTMWWKTTLNTIWLNYMWEKILFQVPTCWDDLAELQQNNGVFIPTVHAQTFINQNQTIGLTHFSSLLWNSVFFSSSLSNRNNLILLSPHYEYFTARMTAEIFSNALLGKTADMHLNMGGNVCYENTKMCKIEHFLIY